LHTIKYTTDNEHRPAKFWH